MKNVSIRIQDENDSGNVMALIEALQLNGYEPNLEHRTEYTPARRYVVFQVPDYDVKDC